MFDGNFRSRREINLGGRRRGRTTKSKAELLKDAESQRKQRQEQQRRDKAARLIQRHTRGLLARLEVLDQFWKQTDNPSAVSMCLSYSSWMKRYSTSPKSLLLNFWESESSRNDAVSATAIRAMDTSTDSHVSAASSSSSSSSTRRESLWFSIRRIVQYTLQELNPKTTVQEPTQRKALFSLVQHYWLSLRKDESLFLHLTNCLQKWLKESNSSSKDQKVMEQSLSQWAVDLCSELERQQAPSSHARSLLASILLSSPSSSSSMASSSTGTKTQIPGDLYTDWFLPLAQTLGSVDNASASTSSTSTNTTRNEGVLYQATMANLQGGKEKRILGNVLELVSAQKDKNPRLLIQFTHHVLAQNVTSDYLAVWASLLVRGDFYPKSSSATTAAGGSSTSNTASEWGDESDEESDMEEDDDDEEEEEEEVVRPDSKKLKAHVFVSSSSTTKYSRKELLTLVKLDKLYQEQIQQRKKDCHATSTSTNDLAEKIVKAPWLQWGLLILDDDPNPSTAAFVHSLATLLQSSTGLRPIARMGVMSPLAFSKQFQSKLWRQVQATSSSSSLSSSHMAALITFCDLFSHYLVALSDVDFQQFHTTLNDASSSSSSSGKPSSAITGVQAKEIIEYLRDVLYELYWNKPVMASDVEKGNERGRLLLAGTKLWNALHERWNRSVRNPFCDESAWSFPHMASKEGDGAVIPARERRPGHLSDFNDDDESDVDDDDSMDIDDDGNDQPMEVSAAEAETDALADTFRDPKMARILTSIPQALPFDRRVKLFHSLLRADKQKTLQAAASRRAMMAMQQQLGEEDMWFDGSVRERVRIRRAALYKDSMQLLNELGPKLKHQVQVSFVNQHGAEEPGIDGGGVFKEFLDDLISDGFAAKKKDGDENSAAGAPPLFSITPMQTLAVNFDMSNDPTMLAHYEFLGRVLGKAVYESILVEPQFCLPFLNQLLAKTNSIEDLKNYDEEYYKNLNKLRWLSDADIDGLGLTFELTIGGGNGQRKPRTVELVPGGREVSVTNTNVFHYMHLIAHQLLNVQGARQTKAFLRGFRDLIPASWVRLFSANELQKLIGGDDSVRGIDVQSLKRSMNYLGGYHPSQPYIQDFWDILENELTPEQQRKFLRFMTSCSRQPLLGFASLEPAPSIQQIRLSDEEQLSKNSKLPSSQTCFNLLKLPNYKSRELLKVKLIASIESGAGFELT